MVNNQAAGRPVARIIEVDGGGQAGQSFRHSERATGGGYAYQHVPTAAITTRASLDHFPRTTEMKIMATAPDVRKHPERKKDYKGRIRVRVFLLPSRKRNVPLMLLILAGAAVLITLGAKHANTRASKAEDKYQLLQRDQRKIKDGIDDGDDVSVSDDGQVGNPKKYPDMGQ